MEVKERQDRERELLINPTSLIELGELAWRSSCVMDCHTTTLCLIPGGDGVVPMESVSYIYVWMLTHATEFQRTA